MRVLFFGTSPFAVPTLQALHDAAPRHAVLGVVTQPDRPSGRGLKVHFSPVKELALALGYPVFQPERVRRKPFLHQTSELQPDVLVVAAFGQIIPQSLLDLPRWGGVNVHGSLLPRWRGASPIHHALLEGDTETGVATMQMEATLDTGPTFLIAHEAIRSDDTVSALESRLALLGAPLLVETLDRLEAGTLTATPQPNEGMTYAPPITREMGFLAPESESVETLVRRVRALSPRPGAYLEIEGRLLKVLDAQIGEPVPDANAGTVAAINKTGIAVGTPNGVLLLTRVQPENKGAMNAADWARGARLSPHAPARRPDAT